MAWDGPRGRLSTPKPEPAEGTWGWEDSGITGRGVDPPICLGENACNCHRYDETLEANGNTSDSPVCPKNIGESGTRLRMVVAEKAG